MTITTCLWFQGDVEQALERYTSVFPDSEVLSLETMPGEPPTQLAEWRMLGTTFRAISQPSDFRFTEAMSLSVTAADQDEVDRYWSGLLDGGGEESMCGWLKDPFGVWWQIVPAQLPGLLGDPDPARAAAIREVFFTQRRIVVADLVAAADAASS